MTATTDQPAEITALRGIASDLRELEALYRYAGTQGPGYLATQIEALRGDLQARVEDALPGDDDPAERTEVIADRAGLDRFLTYAVLEQLRGLGVARQHGGWWRLNPSGNPRPLGLVRRTEG